MNLSGIILLVTAPKSNLKPITCWLEWLTSAKPAINWRHYFYQNVQSGSCDSWNTMFLPSYTDFGGCVLPRNFKIDPINCLQQFSFLKSYLFAFLSSFCSLRIHAIAGDFPPIGSKNPHESKIASSGNNCPYLYVPWSKHGIWAMVKYNEFFLPLVMDDHPQELNIQSNFIQ